MSAVDMNLVVRIEELTTWVEELVPDTASGQGLLVLLCAVAALFVGVVRGRGAMSSYDRHRIRVTAREATAAGATEAGLMDGVRRLAGEAVRLAPGSRPLVDASYVVLADCLAATESPRLTRLRRLLHGDPSQPVDQAFADTHTVAVFRIEERRLAVVIGMLAELDGRVIDGREVFAGTCDDHAVILAPGGGAARRLLVEVGDLLGTPLCAAMADCGRDTLMDGYREAAKVLDLAIAAERDPGLYRIDDFLIEYAAMCDPVVSARLMTIVRPLLGSARLYETLKAFVRCGHNRARTARELFIHRTTMDYRIRRIEEITGYDPASGRGSQVLAAAVTLFSLRGVH